MGLPLPHQASLDSQSSVDSQLSSSYSLSSFSSSLSSAISCSSVTSRGAHKCFAVLRGDQSRHVTTLALSMDFLLAGSDHGEIRGWEHRNLHERGAEFGCGGGAAVKCVVVAGDKVITAHQDNKIRVWRRSKSQPGEHRLVSTLPSVKDYVANFLPAKNYIQVRRHHKSLWINHHDSISTLAVGNGVLYSGSWDKSVKVWSLTDFKCLESLKEHIDAVNALAVDTRNDLLYSGSGDATIKVFQRVSPPRQKNRKSMHVLLATLEAKSPVNALALSPDLSVLYSGQSDKNITAWRMDCEGASKQWTAASALRGHRLAVLCVVTVSNLVISGSADKSVRVWRRDADGAHACVSVMVGHTGPVKALCAMEENIDVHDGGSDAATGAVVYSGAMDGDVRVWSVTEDETELGPMDGNSAPDSPVLVDWRDRNKGH